MIKRHHNRECITTRKFRLYRSFDWLDLQMLESIVSVLPSDWFSFSGWPRFQLTHCNFINVTDSSSRAARKNFHWQKNLKLNKCKRCNSETLVKTPFFKDIVFWCLNGPFVPYRTGDIIFSRISGTLLHV